MRDLVYRFRGEMAARGEMGQGMVEYALIIILIALATVVALTYFGGSVTNLFDNLNGSLI